MKHFAVLVVLALAALCVTPAAAHELTLANATTNCGGYCLSVGADNQLNALRIRRS